MKPREEFNECGKQHIKTGAARQGWVSSEWHCRRGPGCSDCALSFVPAGSRTEARLSGVALSRTDCTVSRRADSPCYLSQPGSESWGWADCDYSLLGSQRGWQEFPGLCHKLRAPWMPSSLVSPVEPFHVSLSRRRLLPGWLARLGSSRAWIISIPIQDRSRKPFHPRRRTADARPARCN